MNLAPNYSIGFDVPAVRGTDEKVQKRSNSTYNQNLKGHFKLGSYAEAKALNEMGSKFGLSNKLEAFGHDPKGGVKSVHMSHLLSKSGTPKNPNATIDNKPAFAKRDQTCNFNVQPVAVKL